MPEILCTEFLFQMALVERLRATTSITEIVPAANIFDRTMRPEVDICIVLGEDQVIREDLTYADNNIRLITTLHLWDKRQYFSTVKILTGKIRTAIRAPLLLTGTAARVIRTAFDNARFFRDPGGDYVHGVVILSSLIQEPVS
jgi:hypothetical protein